MDIFSRMAQNQVTDLSMFRGKRSAKASEQVKAEKKEATIQEPEMEKLVEQSAAPEGVTETKAVTLPKADSAGAEQKSEEEGRVLRFKQPENPNEEAAIKLEAELETAKSNLLPVFPIVRYLKNKCLSDDDFAARVNDKRKTLAKCFSYVTDEVKKALDGRNGWLDDNEVYAYAETYYLTDEAVFEQIAAEKAEAEKKRQEEVAKKRKEQEEKRKKANEKKKKKEPEVKKKEPVAEKAPEQTEQPEMQEQLCLQM